MGENRFAVEGSEMCIFNVPVVEVGGTRIFAAPVEDGQRQVVVYRNYVTVEFARGRDGRRNVAKLQAAKERQEKKEEAAAKREPTPAMILPFPNALGEKVELLDLSELPEEFFGYLEDCYPKLHSLKKSRKRAGKGASKGVLEVVQVGSYNVSVAESLEDLHRIDRDVFNVADNVASLLQHHYA